MKEVQAVTRIFILFTKLLFEAEQSEGVSHVTKMKWKDQEPCVCVCVCVCVWAFERVCVFV